MRTGPRRRLPYPLGRYPPIYWPPWHPLSRRKRKHKYLRPPKTGLEWLFPQARSALRRHGLLVGVYKDRLSGASQFIKRFINRFYGIWGFEWVVRYYFREPYKRACANLAVRFVHQMANRLPDAGRRMGFEMTLGFAPGGHLVQVVEVTYDQVRYQIKPWTSIDPITVSRQLLRDIALANRLDLVRWVFDGRRLRMSKRDVIQQIRKILTKGRFSLQGHPNLQKWLDALHKVIIVI